MEKFLKKSIPKMLKIFSKKGKQQEKYDNEETWEIKAKQYNLKRKKNTTWRMVCESIVKKLCEECSVNLGTDDELFGIKLCKDCQHNKDKYKKICCATIKKEYFLNNRDLENLSYVEVKNPHYRSAKSMRLYAKSDVEKRFREKHNISPNDPIYDKLHELFEKRKNRSLSVRVSKKNKLTDRKAELISALAECGLELRDDSKLCKKYIDGTISREYTLESVVKRMCEMKYLYDYCDMDGAYEIAHKEYYEVLNAGYFPDVDILTEAEHIALRKNGGRYPARWPWL
jgi:hypothetical protein